MPSEALPVPLPCFPSAIRRSADFEPDSAEVEGALSHDSIPAADLAKGRFDGARVLIGVVDWETQTREVLYRGTIGTVTVTVRIGEQTGGLVTA